MTKAELIRQYEKGNLQDLAVCPISNNFSVVIVYFDLQEEKVFGYLTGEPKTYFYVKYRNHGEDDYSFKVHGTTFKFSEFLSIR